MKYEIDFKRGLIDFSIEDSDRGILAYEAMTISEYLDLHRKIIDRLLEQAD